MYGRNLGSTLTVSITASDIAAGVPRRCDQCAVAVAINRLIGRKPEWYLGRWYADVHPQLIKAAGKWYTVPEPLREFMGWFDRNKKIVGPGVYTLTVMPMDHCGEDEESHVRSV